MNPDANDGYDEEFDFPEPPINPSPGAVSLSFYHPEWNFNDLGEIILQLTYGV